MDRRAALTTLGAGLGALAWPGAADAYLLPTKYVLKKAARRLRGSKGLTAALMGEVRPDGRGDAIRVGERWMFGAVMRIDVKGPAGEVAAHDSSKGAGGQDTGTIALLPRLPVRVVLNTLFGRADPSGLFTAIEGRRDAQHLALIGQRPTHVLGASIRQKGGSRLWIDQADFTVRRVQFSTDQGRVDIRLDDWEGPITGGKFPHRLSVRLGGRAVRALDTLEVKRG